MMPCIEPPCLFDGVTIISPNRIEINRTPVGQLLVPAFNFTLIKDRYGQILPKQQVMQGNPLINALTH